MARATAQDPDELPALAFAPQDTLSSDDSRADGNASSIDLSSVPPAFTPTIKTILNKPAIEPGSNPIPLPDGLSAALLKGRLDGKKKIRGALLTPKEMEDLTESWKPYRSIGVYYMWSLAMVTE